MTLADLLDIATFAAGVTLVGFLFGLGFLGAFTLVDAIQSRRP